MTLLARKVGLSLGEALLNRHGSFIVKEILRYVSFDGKAAIVSNTVIDLLKHILSRIHKVHVEDLTNQGMPVTIEHKSGFFKLVATS